MKQINLNSKEEDITINVNVDSEIRGTFVVNEGEVLNLNAVFIHRNRDVKSDILIKAIVYRGGYFNMNGMLKIEKGAKNVDSYLTIRCLLIDETSRARVIPSLEITEDEVKAGHGATIGYLDRELLDYIKSRGLNESYSKKLLIDSFLS
ncbi:MAG: SufD family Fe-S cluster assembly protein [Candidatus Dojkabacteria bacterium]|nr:SufD family Fe-S cluster assembly protein [Candidatus Dojkabacteria bacterium]MDQ7020294.1 SufD family Fe-S cluster assembly protein [Candidatus Dojkabacteria bacterium]